MNWVDYFNVEVSLRFSHGYFFCIQHGLGAEASLSWPIKLPHALH